jgi:hypothetical protein
LAFWKRRMDKALASDQHLGSLAYSIVNQLLDNIQLGFA